MGTIWYDLQHIKLRKHISNICKRYIWEISGTNVGSMVVQILRLAGDVIHLSNLNGWTIPYYKSLPGSHLTIPKITHVSPRYFSYFQPLFLPDISLVFKLIHTLPDTSFICSICFFLCVKNLRLCKYVTFWCSHFTIVREAIL